MTNSSIFFDSIFVFLEVTIDPSNNNTPYIVNKFFEIPAAGCLLLAYDEYVQDALKELTLLISEHANQHDDRIRSLEKRQWMMMGAAAVLGFLIGNLDFFQLIFTQ